MQYEIEYSKLDLVWWVRNKETKHCAGPYDDEERALKAKERLEKNYLRTDRVKTKPFSTPITEVVNEPDIAKRIQSLRDDGMTSVARDLDHEFANFMKRLEDAEEYRDHFWESVDRPSMFHVKQAD